MIFRSAFWLAVGFLLVAPHGTDFGAIATDARNQAISAGTEAARQLITAQALAEPAITQAVATAVVNKLVTSPVTSFPNPHDADLHPMQGSPARPFVFPFPRPAALG